MLMCPLRMRLGCNAGSVPHIIISCVACSLAWPVYTAPSCRRRLQGCHCSCDQRCLLSWDEASGAAPGSGGLQHTYPCRLYRLQHCQLGLALIKSKQSRLRGCMQWPGLAQTLPCSVACQGSWGSCHAQVCSAVL